MRIALVLLTLNEIAGLRVLFDRIPFDCVDETFCVDGGSTDGTREFYREREFRVLDQTSSGRGEAAEGRRKLARVLSIAGPIGTHPGRCSA